MPSPLGHALAGATVAWLAGSIPGTPRDRRFDMALLMACAGLALAPDLDFVYPPVHRMMSHSIVFALCAGGAAWLVARRRCPGQAMRVSVICGLAYASHLMLDWLGGDPRAPAGIQLAWSFSNAWYISSWNVFHATDIRRFFQPEIFVANAIAVLREVLLAGPVALAAWLLSRRRAGP